MIQALDRNNEYLMGAYLIKRGDVLQPNSIPNPAEGIFFKCKLLDAIIEQPQYAVKNLMTYGGELSIETLHNFRVGTIDNTPTHDDYVFLEDKWYVVKSIQIAEQKKEEKTLGLARMRFGNNKIVINLVEETVG